MKLSSALIAETLEKQFSVLEKYNLKQGEGYLRPVFYAADRNILSGHICIASSFEVNSSALADAPLDVFFLFLGSLPAAPKPNDVSFLVLEKETSLSDVFNRLQLLYDTCEAWEKELNTILIQGGAVQELLRVSAGILGNPLSVLGADFSRAAEYGTEDIPAKLQLYSGDSLQMEQITALMQDDEFHALENSREPTLFPASITGLRSLNLNLSDDTPSLHRLLIIELHRPIKEGDKCLLKVLGDYVKHLLYQEQVPEPKQTDALKEVLITALSDRTADYVTISHRLSALGWNSNHNYLCLIFQLTYVDQKIISIPAISRYMQKLFPDSCCFSFREEIVTFFNLTKLSLDKDDVSGKLTYFIRDSFLKAGYSRTMIGHTNLRRQYVQARTALDVGSRTNPYLWIHHFSQVALTSILEQSTRRLPGYMLCHEKLLELDKTDREQHSEYMATLKTYLRENLNATKASDALFIHRSTFLYRLERIKSILESNLDDPDELFYLHLSFRLLEQESEKN